MGRSYIREPRLGGLPRIVEVYEGEEGSVPVPARSRWGSVSSVQSDHIANSAHGVNR